MEGICTRQSLMHLLVARRCLALLSGALAVCGCDRDPGGRAELVSSDSTRYPEAYVARPATTEPGTPGTSRASPPNEGSIPLPPGWSSGPAASQAAGGTAAGSQYDPWPGTGSTAEGQPDDPAAADSAPDDRPYDQSPQDPSAAEGQCDPWPATTAPPPSPGRGNYTVMILVFAVPLLLTIPIVWFWHLLRTYRSTGPARL